MGALDFGMDFELMKHDIEALNEQFASGGADGCKNYIRAKQEEWKKALLNIAVIGSPGVGKSSFINAIRRLTGEDEDAAAVGVTETKHAIMDYPHPNNCLVKFWELPGVGATDKFPKETYLDAINHKLYDFFVLLTATRFTENDAWLAREIAKLERKCVFVRTKINVDVCGDRLTHPKTHKESDVVARIRQNAVDDLKKTHATANAAATAGASADANDPTVFLVDSYRPHKYDFDDLERTLIGALPSPKRQTMTLSVYAVTENVLRLKVAELRSRQWKLAVLASGVAAVALPGSSIVFDTSTLRNESSFYYRQLGLDDRSLEQLARSTWTDVDALKAVVAKTCGTTFLNFQGLKALADLVPKGVVASSTDMVIDEFARQVPFAGLLIASPPTFGGTYFMLKVVLDKLETVAVEVIRFATAQNEADEQGDD